MTANQPNARIAALFSKLAAEKQKALVTYIMGGDPANQGTAKLMRKLVDSGADIIELGMPFSDPMADGPIIQQAAVRALKNKANLQKTLNAVADFREQNQETPVILMGYYNPIMQMGTENFCQQAQASGADGAIIVDLPLEEEGEAIDFFNGNSLDLIRLIAPTSKERLPQLLKNARGFIYYISIAGITGTTSAEETQLQAAFADIKPQTDLPIVAGFGIKTPKDAADFAKAGFAGVVTGSALIKHLAIGHKKSDNNTQVAEDFVKSLKDAIVKVSPKP